MTRRWFVSCPKGLEYLLVDEARALGAESAREGLAGVRVEADEAFGYRACLHSRLASRVLMPLAEFDAGDADALYEGVRTIDWSEHLDPAATLAVDALGRTPALDNAQFVAQRVKDAIADQCRERFGVRPSVERERPSLRVNLALRHGRATLSIDFAGEALHRRGWRADQGAAPLKENLAAAMLLRAQWPELYAAGGALVDPMCGSGTLVIEAALMAADVAPGLTRDYWGFLGWRGFDSAPWQALLDAARERASVGLKALNPVFYGFDRDARVLDLARRNAQRAGVAGFVVIAQRQVATLEAPPGAHAGLVIVNPPYGGRLGTVPELLATYAELGATLKRAFVGWRAAVITSGADLAHALELKAERRYALRNGALDCTLYCFDRIDAPGTRAPVPPKPLSAGAQSLANRLGKNLDRLKRWREREAVSCFRAYDADLPEYAGAIDVYRGVPEAGGEEARWLHLQEYEAPKTIPVETAARRWRELVRVASEVLEVPRERIAQKTRRPQSRSARYRRLGAQQERLVVQEGGLAFLVNLFDYLDTGLFLDHRPMRARIRAAASGRRFLNLFCYTGTASVYAAAGGAASTTSVDLSPVYLEWAGANLLRNGFAGTAHRLVEADVLEWLEAERTEFDLIFVDPPTFSNSKKADDFDVQRDQVRLLDACAARLAPDGLILFSNNFRRFKLDPGSSETMQIEDITRATIPPDFARDQRIHHSYVLRVRQRN